MKLKCLGRVFRNARFGAMIGKIGQLSEWVDDLWISLIENSLIDFFSLFIDRFHTMLWMCVHGSMLYLLLRCSFERARDVAVMSDSVSWLV